MGAPHCAAMTAFIFPAAFRAIRRQHGAAALEFAVAGAAVLLLGLLCIEAVQWQGARQMAHLALTEAARAGATGHGDPARMRAAFLRRCCRCTRMPRASLARGGAWTTRWPI